MVWKNAALVLVAGILVLSAGCQGGPSGADIKRYFGKTQGEIKEEFGEPVIPGAMAQFSMGGLKYTQEECANLPKVFVELQFFFSDAGYCYSIGGVTKRCDTPKSLLKLIGLSGFDIKATRQDALGFSYEMPPYELVQLHRPSSAVKQYDHFIATNSTAGRIPVR